MKKNVLVFSQHLLRYSETFVLAQTNYLDRFSPFFVGLQRVSGLSLPPGRSKTIASNKIGSIWYKITNSAPNVITQLKNYQPALMHAHFEDGGIFSQPIVSALKLPLITTFHGFDATISDKIRFPNPLVRKLYLNKRSILKNKGDLFIAVSDFIRKKIIERGYPPEKIVTHHIGVDVDYFNKDNREVDFNSILFIGRLVEKKGCEYLLRAMSIVQKKHPHVKLVLIGDGPLRPYLELLSLKLNLKNIFFKGVLRSSEIRDYMSTTSILVAPSITASSGDSEGLPIVVCEAQSMGLPVIATLHSGIPDAVKHGVTGFLSAERDVEQLATNLLTLLGNKTIRNNFAINARQNAERNFNLRIQTSRLEDIYDNVLQLKKYRISKQNG